MKQVRALFIDCDGVLYNKDCCTYHDIAVVGFGKTLAHYDISEDEFQKVRTTLREQNVRGLLNAALALCNLHDIQFNDFATRMVSNTDYSRILEDWDILRLLKSCGEVMPIYIVTNNTAPHLDKVLTQLHGGQPFDDVEKQLNIRPITIENTLADGVFHPKKTGTQMTDLCKKIGQKPENVLLLDDTTDVCLAASAQGLQVTYIQSTNDTKAILRRMLYEKSKPERIIPVRKTRRSIGR
ncbi:MAG: HAD family hydrolase [Alphaproteobacteria bacterium]|nr:HAD family hydrolase [Alphaproteobacteria bacterium]